LNAARHLSVDAFPDVTNVQVQVATGRTLHHSASRNCYDRAPGHD
jgi:Cu/Ag efflux pump CusA